MKPTHIKKYDKHPVVPRKPLDRLLESLRFEKAKPHIPKGVRLLDISAQEHLYEIVSLCEECNQNVHDKIKEWRSDCL